MENSTKRANAKRPNAPTKGTHMTADETMDDSDYVKGMELSKSDLSKSKIDPTQPYHRPPNDEDVKGQVANLVHIPNNDKTAELSIKKFVITEKMRSIRVGRDPNCEVSLAKLKGGSGVSSTHIKIDFEPAGKLFFITDVSSNGIRHNCVVPEKGTRLPLKGGDSIKMGYDPEITFLFQETVGKLKGIHAMYDLRTKIGCGNFSEVKLGISRKNGKKYAVKILDRKRFEAFSRKQNTHLDFASEVETLTKLKHPNIVRYFEYREEGDLKYVVTEFLEGGDLLQRLLDYGKYSEQGTMKIFYQLLCGLKYLHDMRIVHRDLKPENVLLSNKNDDAKAKIADFGLARILPPTTPEGAALFKTFCGTPHYFAPELIKCQRGIVTGYGKEVDLWSAGVILYILLSTTPPFEDENLYQKIVRGEYVFDVPEWDSVPDIAKEFVTQLMNVDVAKRLTVEEALDHGYLRTVREERETAQLNRSKRQREESQVPRDGSSISAKTRGKFEMSS